MRILYGQIAQQLAGLLWKDGGPVIGIQLENEYSGPAQHLLTLKQLAREAGLEVPLYTRTGWPQLRAAMPFGELIPLYGVYAEGFWDRELTPMPGEIYWAGFQFSALRTEGAFGTDIPGEHTVTDGADVPRYPYLSCEIGGGMMSSYHRRILVNPLDSESTTLFTNQIPAIPASTPPTTSCSSTTNSRVKFIEEIDFDYAATDATDALLTAAS